MARIEETVICDNCGVEITWSPIEEGGRDYCCQDCRDGYPCACGSRYELEDDRRSGVHSVSYPAGYPL
jgi:hypothetical protein